MEKLLPVHEPIEFVPESYIQLPEIRPGNVEFSVFKNIPVIDLSELEHDRVGLAKKLLKAGEDTGIFFLINHGVPEELIQEMMNLVQEFHELPSEDKANMYSYDKAKMCRYYSSLDYENEKVHFWRNILVHNECQPAAELNDLYPENPTRFRELAGIYSAELRKVFQNLVDLICEGLGIDAGHCSDIVMERQKLAMNYYPPCPDPSLVLGLPAHVDTNPLTILVEKTEYPGYQILLNGEWVSVSHPPNSMIVNFGYTWEVISNGKIIGDAHRVILNDKHIRLTIAGSIHPNDMSIVEPAKELINELNPAKYEPAMYKDLHNIRKARYADGKF